MKYVPASAWAMLLIFMAVVQAIAMERSESIVVTIPHTGEEIRIKAPSKRKPTTLHARGQTYLIFWTGEVVNLSDLVNEKGEAR